MGMLDAKYKLSPRDERVESWDSLSDSEKDQADLKMAVYAAMVDRMDQGIGKVLAKIKALGKWEDTLVLFLADNGGCPETPDTTPNIPPGPVEGYRALGPAWANASNAPYRKYKSTDYEGGACTPFIASWPGVIKPGTMTDQVGHIIDVVPTFMEVTGAAYPDQINGKNSSPWRANRCCQFSRENKDRDTKYCTGSLAGPKPFGLANGNLSGTARPTGSCTTLRKTEQN